MQGKINETANCTASFIFENYVKRFTDEKFDKDKGDIIITNIAKKVRGAMAEMREILKEETPQKDEGWVRT